ncbi:Ppx/GppA family phosphatase [Fusobacterium sp. MFO224]|uniref:Ppx/GppA phosphatase family protein n=1 Tax=Fusobacterium sp. MFO224 TaxID=3378070 RepID=UPI003853AC30
MYNKNYVKAVIDIGTNSCRLFLAKVQESNGKISILDKLYKETRVTKLGNFIEKDSTINEKGMKKLIDVIKYYNKKIKSYKCEEIVAFATSAIREAKNKDEIKEQIMDETGIDIKIITGDEEGRITFLGTSEEFKEKILLMDIGGGSTEFIFGDSKEIEYIKSFKLGAVRETRKYFENDNYEKIEECKKDIREKICEIEKFKGRDFLFVGVAGTISTNVSVYEKMENYDTNRVHKYRLTRERLEKNLKLFLSKSLEERKKIIGLQPERGENVVTGTLIILEVMSILNKNEVIASECDGLEGAMINLYN